MSSELATTQENAVTVPRRKKFSARGFTSLVVAWAFFILSFSGIILFLTPRGRDAKWTDWTLLGLGKEGWGSLHVNVSILFLVFAVVHLVLNWKVFLNYLKKKRSPGLNLKRELVLSALVAVGVVAGAIYEIPPFGTVMAYNMDIKDYWSRQAAAQTDAAPIAHAEDLTLTQFAGQIGLNIEEVTDALRKEGYDIEDNAAKIAQLAESKGVAPRDVLADIRKHFPSLQMGPGQGRGGFGRGAGKGSGADHKTASDCGSEMGDEHGFGMGRGGMGGGMGRGMGGGMGGGMGRGMGGGRGQGQGRGEGDGAHSDGAHPGE